MKEQVFKWVVKRPFVVILGLLILVMAATYGGSKLTFESDYRVFFSDENPQLMAFEKVQDTFTKNDSVAFVVAPKDGVVFSEKTLTAIHALTTESWQIPYASRVDSVTNYQHTSVDGDDLMVADLVLEPELLPELDLEGIKQITLNEPLLLKKLISNDASVSVVNVTVQLPGLDPATELPEVVTKVREIRSQMLADYPDMDIYLSGIIIMNNTFSEAALDDSATLIPLMFGVVALVMMLLLRSISGSIATIIVVMCSIMATMGLVGWLGFYITGPSASAPTVIMTLAVADCIHILATMLYEMRHGKTKNDAILESLRVNFQPVLLTSVTTAIGFLSMNFSDSPPFRDLGNFVAIGVMLAFLFSITLFPALLRLLPIRFKVFLLKSASVKPV
jgi:predicted RND superfamily exporter protein